MDIYSVLMLLGFIACCFLAALTSAFFRPVE
jgi:TspO/MBR family